MQNATKNFTPDKLAKYFNDNQVIDTGAEVRFKYVVLNVGEERPYGSVTFVPQQGNTVAFSGITSFILSKRNTAGNLVPNFIEFLIDKKILISKTRDINTFGYYNVVSVEEYEPEPNFYEVNIEFIAGNGGLTKDIDFVFEFISNAVFFDYDFDAPLELNGTTVSINQATSTTDGYLSADDWNTFNDKQNELTNPITGTGTESYVPRFTGTTTIEDGAIFDDGTKIGIGTTTLTEKVNIVGKIDIVDNPSYNNVFIGRMAGTSNGNGYSNTAIGYSALKNAIGTANNTVLGSGSGLFSSGSDNTIIGGSIMAFSGSNSSNTAIGYQALFQATSSSFNTAVGKNSLGNVISATYNIAVGDQSGRLLTTGTNSVYLGNFTTASSGSVTNEVVIGSNNAGIGSNTVVLGNSSIVTTALRGNVGLGTTTPGARLDVRAQGALSTDVAFRVRNSADTADLLSVLGNGNVGIGTTTTRATLDVVNTPSTTLGTNIQLRIGGGNNTSGHLYQIGLGASNQTNPSSIIGAINNTGSSFGNSDIFFATRNVTTDTVPSERMRITSTGNVGIGTTSPQVDLEVASKDATSTVARIRLTNKDLSVIDEQDLSEIQFFNSDADGAHVSAYIKNIAAETYGRKGQLAFGVSTTNSANAVEALRIDENANVGIGTTSPTEKLDVNGNIHAASGSYLQFGTNGSHTRLTDDSANGRTSILARGNTLDILTATGGGFGNIRVANVSGSSGASGTLTLDSTSNATKGNILINPTGGNVGIGTSVPGNYKLYVNGTGEGLYVKGASVSPFTQTIASFVYGGNNNSVDIENKGGKACIQARGAGVASDLYINSAGGNVGIGATNPGARLDVRAQGALSTDIAFRVRNSADTADLMSVNGIGQTILTPTALTGTSATSALDIAQTWNTTGTPTLIKANVTNTASNASSTLLSLQSNSNNIFRVLNTGQVSIGTNNNIGLWVNDDGTNAPLITGRTLVFSHGLSSQAQNGFVFKGANNNLNATSGTQTLANFISGFNPTSGTSVFNLCNINGTINQTGGANGITRGLYINPTLTSAFDFRAIEVSNGGAYINTTSVQASAILQADSTTKGFLPPRMTNAQRLAIASPAIGLMVYCTDATEGLYINKSTGWTFII
jgi:hypothetical protein